MNDRILVKKTLYLYEGQVEELKEFFPQGYSAPVRMAIDKVLANLRAKTKNISEDFIFDEGETP